MIVVCTIAGEGRTPAALQHSPPRRRCGLAHAYLRTLATTGCQLLTQHGLPCEASQQIRKQIWCKLLYNLAVSPMSTLTDLSLREVFETPGSRQVANLLVTEGLAVAAAEGVNIPTEEADHILQKVPAWSLGNTS